MNGQSAADTPPPPGGMGQVPPNANAIDVITAFLAEMDEAPDTSGEETNPFDDVRPSSRTLLSVR